ncbi:Der1-like family-domain-containing protein [Flagelloscypha sp. PMI_526]|nr:Der1-like family-domain-containing protein [Flagelloscypha sp. PMI_526]
MDGIAAELRKIPLVTRVTTLSAVIMTLGTKGHAIPWYLVGFDWSTVVWKLQVWRIYTSCFIVTNDGISIIFDIFMWYKLVEELEQGPYLKHPANFAWQLFLNVILLLGISYPLSPSVLWRPLLASIAYLGSSLAPIGAQTSFLGLFSFPRKYMPYTLVLFDFLHPMGGPRMAALTMAGLVSGHIWSWAIWGDYAAHAGGGRFRGWGVAPRWLVRWIGGTRGVDRDAREDQGPVRVTRPRRFINPDTDAPASSTTGYSWGSGQRLGSG